MKLIIGSDHGGFELKQHIIEFLQAEGHEVVDLGTNSEDSVDYPDYAKAVVQRVIEEDTLGILLCGTGIGISIAANKQKGIRCANCTNETMASLARRHNDANILALGGRILGVELAKSIVRAFLEASFEGGRHERRVKKIGELNE